MTTEEQKKAVESRMNNTFARIAQLATVKGSTNQEVVNLAKIMVMTKNILREQGAIPSETKK